MGKQKPSKLYAGVSAQPEPQDSWMRDLQLQTVSVDPMRWTQGAQPSALWRPFKPCPRPWRPAYTLQSQRIFRIDLDTRPGFNPRFR